MIAEGVILEQEAESAGAEISVIFFRERIILARTHVSWISISLVV